VRLVTRKGGLVLDPFMGSGTTGVACAVEGMRFVGCEKELAYFEISKRRIGGTGFGMEVEGDDDVEDGGEATSGAERRSAATSQPSKQGLVQGELFG
jgi:DNA modification methylase